MTRPTEADLYAWNDPDDLLRALGQLSADQKDELADAVVSLVGHSDPDVREEAVRTLFVSWKDQQARDLAVNAIRSDDAPEVRSTAAYAIAATSTAATRLADIRVLLDVLTDEREQLAVRAAAYDALLILHRRPDFPSKRQEFDPHRDVDWAWLRGLPSE